MEYYVMLSLMFLCALAHMFAETVSVMMVMHGQVGHYLGKIRSSSHIMRRASSIIFLADY
eukprot:scaffold8270_cov67-Skeletonema_dohrnii-CCMP3373.AAC.1